MKIPGPEQKVLVTGAAGFIGAKVAGLLLEKGFSVVGVDNLNDYYDISLKKYRVGQLKASSRFQFYHLDVENLASLRLIFANNRFSTVINLAARAGVRASVKEPHRYMATNAVGTLNLLELIREYEIPKLVLASTSSLYAGQETPFVETMPVDRPISPYAASKRAAELLARTWHELYGIDVSVLRYFTVYGPAGRPDMSPWRFINWVASGLPIQLFGDGTQMRDFTFIDDIAEGTVAAMKLVGYEVFNLGCEKPWSILDMIGKIESLAGKRASIHFLPSHATEMNATFSDSQKAESILGWNATTSFDDGLKRTWQWHQDYFGQFAHTFPAAGA